MINKKEEPLDEPLRGHGDARSPRVCMDTMPSARVGVQWAARQTSPAAMLPDLGRTKPSTSSSRKENKSLGQTILGPFQPATKLTSKSNREISQQTSAG